MDLESVEQKIKSLQDNSVEEVTVDYDTYSLEVEALCNGTFITGYVIKYKGITISTEYSIELLLKALERYELYPKSYFEDILSKREEYRKKINFARRINDNIERIREEIFNLSMDIEYYKEVNGNDSKNIYRIEFDLLEDEINKIKNNHSDLLYKEND